MKTKLTLMVLLASQFLTCQKSNEEPLKSLAETISGTYEATSHESFGKSLSYPINGKTISLQIEAVTKDTVRIVVNSISNDIYSPGETKVYPKVAVSKSTCSACSDPVTYRVSLGLPVNQGTLENVIWFDANKRAFYTYIPPNYTKGAVQTAFTKIN